MLIHFSDALGLRDLKAWYPIWSEQEVPCSGNLCEIWRHPSNLLADPLWLGAVCSTLLVPQRQQGVSVRPMQCWSTHPRPQLCAADGCIIPLECSVVARFLGQLVEYLAILLFLLSCYFWLKSPIPLFPHFLSLKQHNNTLKELCHCL